MRRQTSLVRSPLPRQSTEDFTEGNEGNKDSVLPNLKTYFRYLRYRLLENREETKDFYRRQQKNQRF